MDIQERFEAMTDEELHTAVDERKIQGRHLIKKRETLIEKLTAHDSRLAKLDPVSVEEGRAPTEVGPGTEASEIIPNLAEQQAAAERKQAAMPPSEPPAKPPVMATNPPVKNRFRDRQIIAPGPFLQVQPNQMYLVLETHKVNIDSFLTSLRKGSLVSSRSYSPGTLQGFINNGLKLRPCDGFTIGYDQLGVQQETRVIG